MEKTDPVPDTGPELSPEQVRPVDFKIVREAQELRVRWADGTESRYPLMYLRKACPCAACRTERDKPKELLPILSAAPSRVVTVTGAEIVGNYALQLIWSDGHDTGIYEYRYLRSIDPSSIDPSSIDSSSIDSSSSS